MNDLPLFAFGGKTYNAGRDGSRLRAQLRAVRAFMMDGQWHTLAEISAATGYPEGSVSARVRDLRKVQFGSYDVQSRRVEGGNGLWKYRVAL